MDEQETHNPYDRIVKQNFEKFAVSFLQRVCKIDFSKKEHIPEKLQFIEERETDFSFIINPKQTKRYVLHFEFQVADNDEIHNRMLVYFSLLRYKYKLDVKQFILFLGVESPKYLGKPFKIGRKQVKVYEVICLCNISYLELLNSNEASEVIMAILCNFEGTDAHEVVRKILERLKTISDQEVLLRYIFHLKNLSQLRNLHHIVMEELAMIKELGILILDPQVFKN